MLVAMAVYDTVENNRTWMTRATLDSVMFSLDFDRHRLFVIDNASCEATLKVYEEFHPFDFTVIRNASNLGTARAINRAWRLRLPGEHCVKIDNDVVFYQFGWADWMEDVFDRDPTIGICGLKRKDLMESPFASIERFKSSVRMLPHEEGQRWLVVEDVKSVIGTCQAYSAALLDEIGYLVQPGLYGFDDSLSAVRSRLAGFKSVFLHGFEIDHIDPGGDEFCEWKRKEADRLFPTFNTEVVLYESGIKSIYYDGGFDTEVR